MLGVGPTALDRKNVLDKMLEEGIHSSLQAEKSEDGDGASPGWHMLAQVHDMFLQQIQGEHGGMIRRYFRRFFYKYWLTRQNL